MKKLQICIRRDKFARERPGPRELRRPPSPPSSYWRPPPSRPPPRAYPYPPPSVPREVRSKTATNHKLNDFAATNPSYAYQQHLTFCSSQTTIPSLSLSLSCQRSHVGNLLPIMEEVEVHHLQEDLQASDRGRRRELELSRFNFLMTDQ